MFGSGQICPEINKQAFTSNKAGENNSIFLLMANNNLLSNKGHTVVKLL